MDAVTEARNAVRDSFAEFGHGTAVLTSFQREGVVLLDLALQVEPGCRVLTIDTGRLPAATHRMMSAIEAHFGIRVERILPDDDEVETMVSMHGEDLFRDSVAKRRLCCEVRKVRSLARFSRDLPAILVGLRKGQSETRNQIEIFDRSQSPAKISPLANWTAEEVLAYTCAHGLPEHPLYAKGYRSIGCDPCTRASTAGEDDRSGRWWWETDADKECGLHFAADGKVMRTVDVLLDELTGRTRANEIRA